MSELEQFDRQAILDQLIVGLDLDEIRRQVNNGKQVFIDSETCGLHSMMVLWQFAIDNGPIYLYHLWKEPVWKTIKLFEMLMELDYCGFNLSFDHFHLAKIYTIWKLLPPEWVPEEHIEEIAINYERKGQDGPCIKPKRACDLMLWSRKGKFQTAMSRNDIRIRRVPTILAYALARELEQRVKLPDICFARAKDPHGPRWKVYDRNKPDGMMDDAFKDVCLRFNPHGGLKYLAEHALGWKPKYHFSDVEVDRKHSPPDKKLGFIPTALGMAPGGPQDEWRIYDKHKKVRGHAWPFWIKEHIDHWYENEKAQEYAYMDIVYTRALYEYFDSPEPGDDDSELACMVGAVRWHGFTINEKGIKQLCKKAMHKLNCSPININKPTDVRAYITAAMDDIEALHFNIVETTKKSVLKDISTYSFTEDEHGANCTKCEGTGCLRCANTGTIDASEKPIYDKSGGVMVGNHPAARRAREILDIKTAAKEVELYQKLLWAKKFHPDFNVIGTLSTRMSGGSGLNAQGIKHDKSVRSMFPLKWEGMVLSGGDFDGFEVVLAAAVYKDKDLFDALTKKVPCVDCLHGEECEKCCGVGKVGGFDCLYCQQKEKKPTGIRECKLCGGKGWFRKKIHALFGMALFPPATYEQVVESDGTSNDMYTAGKSGVFAMIYGGDWATLRRNLGIDEEIAKAAEQRFFDMFPGIPKARKRVIDMFQSMRQIDGRQILWHDPEEYIESFLGFRRSFQLENEVCKTLYDLAMKPPKEWRGSKVKVMRSIHKGAQTAGGAVSSALFGAAFGLQGANVRAAANHEIQSPGGAITKSVQRKVWDLQPVGVHTLVVAPLNIHDEILSVTHPEYIDPVAQVVKKEVESYRNKVPLIGMTWNREMENWAHKKGGSVTLKISPPEMQ